MCDYINKWTRAWQNQQSDLWAISLRCQHEVALGPWLPIKSIAKTDQTGQMPWLIWVFWVHMILLVLSFFQLILLSVSVVTKILKQMFSFFSTTCEIIIFLFLGLMTIHDKHDWKTGFTLWTMLLCLVYRFLSMYHCLFCFPLFCFQNFIISTFEPRHDKTNKRVCAKRRLRSAWASAQSDQSLRCPHEETLGS